MKKIKNILGVILVLVGMTAMFSCQDDAPDYIAAEKIDSEQVYFPSTISSNVALSSLENSFDIIIARVKTDNAITVPLTITGNDGLYNIPSSVTFAQGESKATLKITYDAAEIGFDNFSDLSIKIGDEYTSVYGKSEYLFKIGVPSPWESLGDATYADDYVSTWFGVGNDEYKVEIQENLLQPGLFRLVNPYGAAYPYNEPGDWDDSQDWYFEINAVDPTAVFINLQEVGMDWGYGMFSFGSIAALRMSQGKTLEEVKEDGLTGTFENGVITFPAGQLLAKMADYNDGGMYPANGSGAFVVVMPGVIRADYSIDVNYIGRFINLDDASYVVAEVELGEDVANAKIALVADDSEILLDDIVEGIDDGSIEAMDVSASGNYNISCDEDGDYILVAVSYNEDGELQEVDTDSFEYAVDSVDDVITSLSAISTRSAKIGFSKNTNQLKNLQGKVLFR
ncbi:MAG: hypothetical protein ITF98_00350 [Fermentimonas sp.]|nr:hypothetical protein [Fermentimonas sp.]